MWTPGPMELIVILAVVLIFGAKRLPEIGSGLGKGIRNFRRSFKEADEIDVTPEPDKIPGPNDEAKSSSAESSTKQSS